MQIRLYMLFRAHLARQRSAGPVARLGDAANLSYSDLDAIADFAGRGMT
jgi:hypothetical protein